MLKDEKEVEVGPPWNPLARRVPRRVKEKKRQRWRREEEDKGNVKSRVYIVKYSIVIGRIQCKVASDWSDPDLACRAAGTWRVDLPEPGSPAWNRASSGPYGFCRPQRASKTSWLRCRDQPE
jgi:hypothetical protein